MFLKIRWQAKKDPKIDLLPRHTPPHDQAQPSSLCSKTLTKNSVSDNPASGELSHQLEFPLHHRVIFHIRCSSHTGKPKYTGRKQPTKT